jgi:hypothetical protein
VTEKKSRPDHGFAAKESAQIGHLKKFPSPGYHLGAPLAHGVASGLV